MSDYGVCDYVAHAISMIHGRCGKLFKSGRDAEVSERVCMCL